MTRVAVFIDYENSRFGAREVFGDPRRDPYTFGHVKPQKLALMLKQLSLRVTWGAGWLRVGNHR